MLEQFFTPEHLHDGDHHRKKEQNDIRFFPHEQANERKKNKSGNKETISPPYVVLKLVQDDCSGEVCNCKKS